MKQKPKQRLEKYSERFDNDESAIGNPETWGKRVLTEEDKCPSCGSPCDIHSDLDENDECNDCRESMHFHECSECNIRCNCTTAKCSCDCRNEIDVLELGQIIPKEEPKQKTLEEVAEMHFEWTKNDETLTCKDHFIEGAKWQEQQTIEEVFEWLITNNYLTDLKETLIENFKNR